MDAQRCVGCATCTVLCFVNPLVDSWVADPRPQRLLHLTLLFMKRCLLSQKRRVNSHRNAMVGMFFTVLYVLYLYVTRTML